MMPTVAPKIAPHHLERRAYVYVRQSTPKQVQLHRESQVNQYALVERAIALGWAPAQVCVIDADLGQSGQDGGRLGFQELVAEVSLGRAGIVRVDWRATTLTGTRSWTSPRSSIH
jgi:DNA invertase Pin-like site-specific DNA recombinase